jgi:molybdopterin/thiamine biosynthesis adenylyltransferase
LARSGFSAITLIDGDALEAHNLTEMSTVTGGDEGKPKAAALAQRLESIARFIEPICAPLGAPEALRAAREADLLVCCADDEAARVAAAIIATTYHKVLLDIGTGVFFDSDDPRSRRIGADIRLIIPGENRCLLCMGGVPNQDQAIRRVASRHFRGDPLPWDAQRAGSLRSLNEIAVGIGLRLLEDLVAERVTASTWTHVEFSPEGRMEITYPSTALDPDCSLCAQAGMGDMF